MTKSKTLLNRRQIRGKVLQALYAWVQSESSPEQVFRQLLDSDYQQLRKGIALEDRESDAYFLRELFYSSVTHRTAYEQLLTPYLQNWEWERIALVDRVILLLALVELLHFESIPTRVTLNEALELAKTFSTEKSSLFVNGILDAAMTDLKTRQLIRKTGKGLLDFSKPRSTDPS